MGNILFKGIYYIFLTAVFAMGILLVTSVIGIGGIQVKIVQSGSMEPAIPVGSIVVIKPSADYNAGDVITFGEDTREKVPTTHRIIDERIVSGEARYVTKGDANEERDAQEVRHREVIGKVLVSAPYVGFVLDFARKPLGFALLIGVPAAMIVVDEVSKIVTEVRRMRRKKHEAIESEQV